MNGRELGLVLREAWATIRAQPISSAVTIVIIAAMCSTVLLTSGRAAGAQNQILSAINSASTRSIVVRANPGSGLDSSVVERLRMLSGVSWVGAFSASLDVTNSAIPGGPNVSERTLAATDLNRIGVRKARLGQALGPIAFASESASRTLALVDGVGGVVASDQQHFAVIQSLALPRFLKFLEPVIVSPAAPGPGKNFEVSALVVIARNSRTIGALTAAIRGVLGVPDLSQVSISTSEAIAKIHDAVRTQLGSFNTNLLAITVVSTASLVATILVGLVLLRRRDFGRRRALGATRSLIVGLLLVQVLELALLAVAIGCAMALVILACTGNPLPPLQFIGACATLAIVASLVGAIIPAVVASRRDPLKELRVP